MLTTTDNSILVADDSLVSRRLLEAVLRKWGFDVVLVSSGTEAWEVLQREDAPKLAILDWMMPGLSGPEVCSLVRENRSSAAYTYIILLTSRNEKEDLIAGMEAGADDYLVKPFDNNELKVRLGPGRRIVELQSQLLAAQEALRVQATRDSLTGLWNRPAISEILVRELSRSVRENIPLGLILGDLDHFKQVNDTRGHPVGDLVLHEVAQRMANSIRAYDAAGRYGGEEFLLILPGCDEESTLQTAERIRTQLTNFPVETSEGAPVSITASFGATALPRGVDTTPEVLIKLADTALYRAKQAGRNCSVLAPFKTPA
ncbi:MAG: diguanylate cyclase [Bryobacterales bacterium]|nr:diguanylate cyclase [Bryobacterales bacterium]